MRPPVAVSRAEDALVRLGAGYDRLLDDVSAPVTCRRRWLQAWLEANPQVRPWVWSLPGPDGSCDAVAALCTVSRGPLLAIRAVGHGPSDQALLPARHAAAARELAAAVVEALTRLRRPWQLWLDQLPPDCPVALELAERLPHGALLPGDPLPRVEVAPGDDERRFLSKNARQSERTARNRIAAAGLELQERWVSDPDEIAALLPELLAVHRARDLALGRRPDHDDPRALAFYRLVVQRHAEQGEVELLTVRLDGRLAAYTLGLRDRRTLAVWDARLSPEHAAYSAGRLANAGALRRVLADPDFDALDWMRGEEPYKLSSATRIAPAVQLRAASSRLAQLPDVMIERARELRRSSPLAARLAAALGRPAPLNAPSGGAPRAA